VKETLSMSEIPSAQPSKSAEIDSSLFAFIDSFVDSYNKFANVPISDLFEININDKTGEFYRTEFRLNAF